MLRGEFIELNGGADFYANSLAALIAEGERSLAVFLEVCRESGIAHSPNMSAWLPVRTRSKSSPSTQ